MSVCAQVSKFGSSVLCKQSKCQQIIHSNPNVPAGLVGKVQKKNYLPKEEGREGGEKSGARRARGLNPGPATC